MLDISEQFELRYRLLLTRRLGEGKDGRVYESEDRDAVKFFDSDELYRRELRAYQILQRQNINSINGFQLPELIRHDDELRAIQMSIVNPPFILDFASAYTLAEYKRFDFPQEVLGERESHWCEIFDDRWPAVKRLCDEFTRLTGLVLLDLSLNNIKFAAS